MPSRLQNLLGIAPLENLRNKYKNPLDSMNTDLENQVGFNQGMGPLNSANPLQPPAGSFYQNQIQNQGLQNQFDTSIDDSFGGDSGTGDFSAGDLGSIRETKYNKYYTSPEALMEQFFSGLAPSEKSQYQTFTADNILDIEELGALMGFNIDDIRLNKIPEGQTKGLRDLLETMGLEKYSDFFQGTGEKLRNLQELRSGKFKSVSGSWEYTKYDTSRFNNWSSIRKKTGSCTRRSTNPRECIRKSTHGSRGRILWTTRCFITGYGWTIKRRIRPSKK